MRKVLVKRKAFNWVMSFSTHPLEKVVDPENVVYITDEADEILQEFDPK